MRLNGFLNTCILQETGERLAGGSELLVNFSPVMLLKTARVIDDGCATQIYQSKGTHG